MSNESENDKHKIPPVEYSREESIWYLPLNCLVEETVEGIMYEGSEDNVEPLAVDVFCYVSGLVKFTYQGEYFSNKGGTEQMLKKMEAFDLKEDKDLDRIGDGWQNNNWFEVAYASDGNVWPDTYVCHEYATAVKAVKDIAAFMREHHRVPTYDEVNGVLDLQLNM